jgi:hypothetical protein
LHADILQAGQHAADIDRLIRIEQYGHALHRLRHLARKLAQL